MRGQSDGSSDRPSSSQYFGRLKKTQDLVTIAIYGLSLTSTLRPFMIPVDLGNMRCFEKRLVFLVMILGSSRYILGEASESTAPQIAWHKAFDATHTKLHVEPQRNWGLFHEGDAITIRAANHEPVRVFDLYGHVVYDGSTRCTLHLPTGHYFVETDGDRTQFAVLPKDYHGAPFLGTEAYVENVQGLLDKIRQIQPAWVRVMGEGFWDAVQPQRDQWHWAALDAVVARNAARKIIVMATNRPHWVSDDEFIPCYARFVGTMAARYRHKLAAIEIWNEPSYVTPFPRGGPGRTGDQFVSFYVELLRAARVAIKRQDRTIRVVGPTWQDEAGYVAATQRLVELDGAKWLDAFTCHDYYALGVPPDEYGRGKTSPLFDPSKAVPVDERARRTREILGDKSFPIWVDEVGLAAPSALGCPSSDKWRTGLDWFRGMCRAIKTAVIYRTQNVDVLIPHVFAMGSYDQNKNLEIDGWDLVGRGPHPKTSAFLMTCHWLNDARCAELRYMPQAVLSEWIQAGGRRFVIAWAKEGVSMSLRTPTSLQVCNIFGQKLEPVTLGEEPLIFRTQGAGDYSSMLETIASIMEH